MSKFAAFGDYIRELRDRADLGLREAARQLGISASYLSRLEAGEFPPPAGPKLNRMAALYKADLTKLMELAKDRAHDMIAANVNVAPFVQAFYRLAQDQTPEMQQQMLEGAIGALDLTEEQRRAVIDQLKAAMSRGLGKDLPRRAKGDDGLFAFDIAPRVLSKAYIEAFAARMLTQIFGSEIPVPVPIETIVRKLGPEVILIIDGEIGGARLRGGAPAVLGLSRWSRDGERRELVIHADLFETPSIATRRRGNFTMAHELFHCLEHLPLVQNRNAESAFKRNGAFVSLAPQLIAKAWFDQKRKKRQLSTSEDWREWQANAFAAAILMPAASVHTAYEQFAAMNAFDSEDFASVEEFADVIARASFENEFGHTTSLTETFDVNPQAMAIRLISLGLVSIA